MYFGDLPRDLSLRHLKLALLEEASPWILWMLVSPGVIALAVRLGWSEQRGPRARILLTHAFFALAISSAFGFLHGLVWRAGGWPMQHTLPYSLGMALVD